MGSEFGFSLTKFLVYVISFVVLLPLFFGTDNAIYVSFFVYAAGKAVDYIERLVKEPTKRLFFFRIVSILFGVVILSMAFYSFAAGEPSKNFMMVALILTASTCAFDLAELAFFTVKYFKTKKVIEEATI